MNVASTFKKTFLFRIYSKNANLSNPPFFEIPDNPNQN